MLVEEPEEPVDVDEHLFYREEQYTANASTKQINPDLLQVAHNIFGDANLLEEDLR